jgi:hypothetical protein
MVVNSELRGMLCALIEIQTKQLRNTSQVSNSPQGHNMAHCSRQQSQLLQVTILFPVYLHAFRWADPHLGKS